MQRGRKDAVLRTLQAAEIAGHPISTDLYHLLALLRDVKKELGIG